MTSSPAWLQEPTVAARYAKFRQMVEPELAAKRAEEPREEISEEERKLRQRQQHAEYRTRKRIREKYGRPDDDW
jgi:hypothetical protein